MARKVNMAKLMEKIAAQVAVDAKELTKAAEESKDLYSYDEAVMQRQAVINFFTTYVAPEEPRRNLNESAVKFASRVADYNRKRAEWKFRDCVGCKQRFVYAYHYDGVSHCSLECLDSTLRTIGIRFTVGRDLKKRWGTHHPAIVPATALEILERLYGPLSSSLDADDQSSQHKSHDQFHSAEQNQGTQSEQGNSSNTPALVQSDTVA